MKLSEKISRKTSYITIGIYIFLLLANVFHYHSYEQSTNNLSYDVFNNEASHLFSFGSEHYCIISLAYTSLTNSTVSLSISVEFINPYNELSFVDRISKNFISQNIVSYSLRAPPFIFS